MVQSIDRINRLFIYLKPFFVIFVLTRYEQSHQKTSETLSVSEVFVLSEIIDFFPYKNVFFFFNVYCTLLQTIHILLKEEPLHSTILVYNHSQIAIQEYFVLVFLRLHILQLCSGYEQVR